MLLIHARAPSGCSALKEFGAVDMAGCRFIRLRGADKCCRRNSSCQARLNQCCHGSELLAPICHLWLRPNKNNRWARYTSKFSLRQICGFLISLPLVTSSNMAHAEREVLSSSPPDASLLIRFEMNQPPVYVFKHTGGILSKQDQGVGTIFGLLVHVLPRTNKQRARKPGMILSLTREQNNPPSRLVRSWY
jgi:hypothetical protein